MMIMLLGAGFEEIEALATVDILRRAGLSVQTAGIGGRLITGGHGVTVQADLVIEDVTETPELLILPGGLGGVQSIEGSEAAMAMVARQVAERRPLAAICAAPSILGKRGWVDGRQVTCYPGFEPQMNDAVVQAQPCVTDGTLITGRGPGAAIPFALAIVEQFCGAETREEIAKGLVWSE